MFRQAQKLLQKIKIKNFNFGAMNSKGVGTRALKIIL